METSDIHSSKKSRLKRAEFTPAAEPEPNPTPAEPKPTAEPESKPESEQPSEPAESPVARNASHNDADGTDIQADKPEK